MLRFFYFPDKKLYNHCNKQAGHASNRQIEAKSTTGSREVKKWRLILKNSMTDFSGTYICSYWRWARIRTLQKRSLRKRSSRLWRNTDISAEAVPSNPGSARLPRTSISPKPVHSETLSELPDASDVEEICIRKDDALSIYKVLHCLSEPYKEVFTLRVLGDLSYKEIAEIFGKQETWARVTYHRAKLKIQEHLPDESFRRNR